MSFDRLIAKIIETKNPTVVGLLKRTGLPLKLRPRLYLNLIRKSLMRYVILFRQLSRRRLTMKCTVTME